MASAKIRELVEPIRQHLIASKRLEVAASKLLMDIELRYPGEDLKCQYMIGLRDALADVVEGQKDVG